MLMQQKFGPQAARVEEPIAKTFTGNRGLAIEEGLIFEIGRPENTGVDLNEPSPFKHRLGPFERQEPAGLPGLSEPGPSSLCAPSRMNYAIDAGLSPGPCTMTHNPG